MQLFRKLEVHNTLMILSIVNKCCRIDITILDNYIV